ncbi:Uncharacterised protein [Chlamydia trachomatis]|nr:Uncharacterised protein [Chlamydia trachomatis]CRH73718.1 Uncharacterised protein [Chlamydia trachomatis]CRH85955.1 Uncharacterised protein [Chlamydia trachomatis]
MSRHPENPKIVAFPTEEGLAALPEITTAPSIPIKAQRVTNIVLFS